MVEGGWVTLAHVFALYTWQCPLECYAQCWQCPSNGYSQCWLHPELAIPSTGCPLPSTDSGKVSYIMYSCLVLLYMVLKESFHKKGGWVGEGVTVLANPHHWCRKGKTPHMIEKQRQTDPF